jgi:hypothetical protein
MISLTLCLYATSVLTVGLLAAFAVHNQKTGWKKSRTSPNVEWCEPNVDSGSQDVRGFSFQLVNLRTALGESTGVMTGADHLNVESEVELAARARAVSRS